MEIPSSPAQSRKKGYTEATLSKRKYEDPILWEIIQYLLDGTLLTNDQRPQQVALSQSDFTVLDGVFYKIEKDKTLKIVQLTGDCHHLYLEVPEGYSLAISDK